jgi:hypothetical protein
MKSTMYGIVCPQCGHIFDYSIETYPFGYFDKELKDTNEESKD